jgi:hypothetical protein
VAQAKAMQGGGISAFSYPKYHPPARNTEGLWQARKCFFCQKREIIEAGFTRECARE